MDVMSLPTRSKTRVDYAKMHNGEPQDDAEQSNSVDDSCQGAMASCLANETIIQGAEQGVYSAADDDILDLTTPIDSLGVSDLSEGDTDREIADLKAQIEIAKIQQKQRHKLKRRAKKMADIAELKAQLFRLNNESSDEEPASVNLNASNSGRPLHKVTTKFSDSNNRKVHFSTTTPGPADVREAMNAQRFMQEQRASVTPGLRAVNQPSFSVHLSCRGPVDRVFPPSPSQLSWRLG